MPEEIQVSQALQRMLTDASVLASVNKNKLVTPEHILLTALNDGKVRAALTFVTTDLLINNVIEKLRERIAGMESYPEDEPEPVITYSYQYEQLMAAVVVLCHNAEVGMVDVYHLIHEMMDLKDSYAANCLHLLVSDEDKGDFFEALGENYPDTPNENYEMKTDEVEEVQPVGNDAVPSSWRDYVLCINDHLADHNPLIGIIHTVVGQGIAHDDVVLQQIGYCITTRGFTLRAKQLFVLLTKVTVEPLTTSLGIVRQQFYAIDAADCPDSVFFILQLSPLLLTHALFADSQLAPQNFDKEIAVTTRWL